MIRMQMKVEIASVMGGKPKLSTPAAPPPRFWAMKTNADSVTNREIAEFWRQKRIVEDDHLLAAIKAAERIRARNLTEEDYMRFAQSLIEDNSSTRKKSAPTNDSHGDENNWWRKSKYAYLNQPAAVESMDNPRRRAST